MGFPKTGVPPAIILFWVVIFHEINHPASNKGVPVTLETPGPFCLRSVEADAEFDAPPRSSKASKNPRKTAQNMRGDQRWRWRCHHKPVALVCIVHVFCIYFVRYCVILYVFICRIDGFVSEKW